MTVSGCSHVLSFQQVGQLSTVKTCVKHIFFLFDLTIDKATHPTNRQEDWEYIIGFCDQINKELEGYVISWFTWYHSVCISYIWPIAIVWVKLAHFLYNLVVQSPDICQVVGSQNPIAARMGGASGFNSEYCLFVLFHFIQYSVLVLRHSCMYSYGVYSLVSGLPMCPCVWQNVHV